MMQAYSRLNRLLQHQRLSIPELQRRMRAQGLEVNIKSLYRLRDDRLPVERLDMRVAGAICQVCAAPLSEWIVFESATEPLRRLSPETQARLDLLMTGNNVGSLTPPERDELRRLTGEAEAMALENARLLARQRQSFDNAPAGTSHAP